MTYLDIALKVINKIKSNGFEAYIVGGYVRDYLLDNNPNDIDITTSAMPKDIMTMFDKVIPTGIDFEGVTVIEDNYNFEITTFRKDVSYYDHRHPKVEYASSLSFDLARRDFTINAMCLNEKLEVIDLYNGQDDLKNKIIRAVGDPNVRFYEDALRILRAFYFSAKLNFDIEPNTLKGIEANSKYLDNVSGERICRELKKLFNSEYSLKGLNYLNNSDSLNYLPSLKKATNTIVLNKHIISLIDFLALGFYLEGYTDRYKLSKKEVTYIKNVCHLIDTNYDNYTLFNYSFDELNSANELKKLLNKNYMNDLTKNINNLVIHNKKELDISANDIMSLGYSGKEIGILLDKALRLVLDNKVKNEKNQIIENLK